MNNFPNTALKSHIEFIFFIDLLHLISKESIPHYILHGYWQRLQILIYLYNTDKETAEDKRKIIAIVNK